MISGNGKRKKDKKIPVKQGKVGPLGVASSSNHPPLKVSHKRAHITQLIYEIVENNTQKIPPSTCGEKCSLELPDTAEGHPNIEFLHEICNSPKACRDSCFNSNDQEIDITPLAATLLEGGSPTDENYQRIGQWCQLIGLRMSCHQLR
ncbi:unnamed protein product [Ilex paraguariensis]|uniref:Uncharacterized protein n=1 Tax=Ilex paraguariensis TaxID=185542 RepID=A0ABC8UBX1_9AQUA